MKATLAVLLFLSCASGSSAQEEHVVVNRGQALRDCEKRIDDRLAPRLRGAIPTGGNLFKADCKSEPLGSSSKIDVNIRRETIALILGLGDPQRFRIESARAERVATDGDFRFAFDADHVEAFAECSTGPAGPGRTNSFRIDVLLRETINTDRLADVGRLCAASVLPPGSP